jgi:hypothetical protein
MNLKRLSSFSKILAQDACSTYSVGSNDAPYYENDSEETDTVDKPPSSRACDKIVTELLNSELLLRSIVMSMKNAAPEVPLAADACSDKENALISHYSLIVWFIDVCVSMKTAVFP